MKDPKTLSRLRARCKGKVTEWGIWLCVPFRGEPDAREFAELARSIGGDVFEVRKIRQARFTGDLVWKVVFSVGIDEDLYLAGRTDLRAYKKSLSAR